MRSKLHSTLENLKKFSTVTTELVKNRKHNISNDAIKFDIIDPFRLSKKYDV